MDGPNQRQLSYTELDVRNMRRGPRLGPSFTEQVLAADPEDKDMVLEELQEDYDRVIGNLERADTEEWDWYTGMPGSQLILPAVGTSSSCQCLQLRQLAPNASDTATVLHELVQHLRHVTVPSTQRCCWHLQGSFSTYLHLW